jgi:hypothetical protein
MPHDRPLAKMAVTNTHRKSVLAARRAKTIAFDGFGGMIGFAISVYFKPMVACLTTQSSNVTQPFLELVV